MNIAKEVEKCIQVLEILAAIEDNSRHVHLFRLNTFESVFESSLFVPILPRGK